MKNEIKFYKDGKTGNVFTLINKAAEEVTEHFVELKANTTDGAVEKHVPVYEVDGEEIKVRVGSNEHPMTEEHYIMWIALVTDYDITFKKLTPEDEPKATFKYEKESIVYAYCNLHGLWKTIVE